jgi:hypothetical protein
LLQVQHDRPMGAHWSVINAPVPVTLERAEAGSVAAMQRAWRN